ncbi:uncharacterized protein LOC142224041 [Haematobia irritans]|uniref:uncharacterized protein LOC142224041 n=1 Tax=Haematobia irritans TaxID=7368 RepID=UPI003F50AAFF
MKTYIFAFAFVVAVQLTAALPTDGQNEIHSLIETKRYKLIENAYGNFQKSLWPAEILPPIKDYMNDLKKWSDNEVGLKNSKQHTDLQQAIEKCLDLLKKLTLDPENCEHQLALRKEHDHLKTLVKSLENIRLKEDWMMKNANLMLKMRPILKKSSEKFHIKLAKEVETYIQGLNEAEKLEDHDILEWYKKFSQEIDHIRMNILTIEFMGMFPDERAFLEAKCKIQFSNNF